MQHLYTSRNKKNAFTYATIVAMGGFIFGLDAALISGTVNYLVQEFTLNDIQLGAVVSAPGLGVLVALPLAGYASNLLGRKNTLMIIAALYLISAIGSTLAPNYWALVVARFLGGLAFSSITLASMYIGEIAPPEWRGKLVAMTQINIVVGLSAAYFINFFILKITHWEMTWIQDIGLIDHTWRWMLGSEIIPAMIWIGLLINIPKSPSWLLLKGRVDEARLILHKIFPTEAVDAQMNEMIRSIANSKEDRSIAAQLKQVLSQPMRTIFIIATTIAIAQQSTGINAILFYAPTVIEQIGIGTDAAFQQAIWFGLVSIIFTVLSLLLIDRIGRRPMILWGMVWILLSLGLCSWGFKNARYNLNETSLSELTDLPNADRLRGIIGIEFGTDTEFKNALRTNIGEQDARKYASLLLQKAAKMNAPLILLGILSFIAAFNFSVGPIMWVLFSEIFPISIRSIGIPLFALITSITSYLIQRFFPWQLTNMGGSAIFLFYAVTVAIGLVILFFKLPETKNMSIEEIQLKLTRKF